MRGPGRDECGAGQDAGLPQGRCEGFSRGRWSCLEELLCWWREVGSRERPSFAQLLCRAVTVRRVPAQNGSSGPAGSWVYRS